MWRLRARSSRAGPTRMRTPRMTNRPGTPQWRWRWRRGAQRLRRGGEGDSCAGPSAQEAPPRIAHRRGLAIHPPTRIDRPWDHPAVDSRSTSLRFVSLIDSTTSPADHFISEIRWIAETLGQHSENAKLCVVMGVDRHRRLTPKSVHPRLACGRHVYTTCQPRNALCRQPLSCRVDRHQEVCLSDHLRGQTPSVDPSIGPSSKRPRPGTAETP